MLVGLVFLSIFLSLLFSGFKWYESFHDLIRRTSYSFVIGFAFGMGNWAIGILMGSSLNWNKNLKRSNLISLLSFIFWGLFVSIAVPYIFGKFIYRLEPDRLKYYISSSAFVALAIDLIIISIFYSQYLVHFWKKSLDKYEGLERENIKAKYDSLKSQVNPHFLFNSLNTLTGLVEQDQQKAVRYIKKLSDIYRYVLEQRETELVEIGEELSFMDNYIYLAKIRHGDGLSYTYEVSSVHKYIVPLALQILVENCIKHNVISDDSPLSIKIVEKDSCLIVSNNLQKKKQIGSSNAIGLENLKSRYSYISDFPVEITIENNHYLAKIPIVENPAL